MRAPLWISLAATVVAAFSLSQAMKAPVWQAIHGDGGFRFMHFNMCGGVCNKGSTGRLITVMRKSITDFKPQAVSLNEACWSQFRSLREALRRIGYSMEGKWVETMDTAKDCANDLEGIGLLSRRAIRWARAWRLPRPRADVRTCSASAFVFARTPRCARPTSLHMSPTRVLRFSAWRN
jgi:hypothetical protein